MSHQRATASRRAYRKRRRAELEDETRLRITEAAVELHGTVGPARTTVSAIAERAGVQRATVYRHFPDEEALFAACSSHWATQYPPPDVEIWRAIDEPEARLTTGLGQLYAWFEQTEGMLANVIRDREQIPVTEAGRNLARLFASFAEVLAEGRHERGARGRRVAAATGHALAFGTWRSLVREHGLHRDEAVELMTALVRDAARA